MEHKEEICFDKGKHKNFFFTIGGHFKGVLITILPRKFIEWFCGVHFFLISQNYELPMGFLCSIYSAIRYSDSNNLNGNSKQK